MRERPGEQKLLTFISQCLSLVSLAPLLLSIIMLKLSKCVDE